MHVGIDVAAAERKDHPLAQKVSQPAGYTRREGGRSCTLDHRVFLVREQQQGFRKFILRYGEDAVHPWIRQRKGPRPHAANRQAVRKRG